MNLLTMHFGFGEYKKMLDSGELAPGQRIVVGVQYFTVLPFDPNDKKEPVYRIDSGWRKFNAKRLLDGREWDVAPDKRID